jgi:hypothetical protein
MSLRMFAALLVFVWPAVRADAGDLADPMRPATLRGPVAHRPASPSGLRLEGIMSSGPSRLAIVDGRIVRTGDTISGARIVEIGMDSIRYMRGGKEHLLTLPASKLTVRSNNIYQAGKP